MLTAPPIHSMIPISTLLSTLVASTAVVLRYYLDWSEADIASAMGVRPGTVKALLHQGIDELRKVVER